MTILQAFWRNTRAATSIEYAIIGVLLSVLVISGATAIGTRLNAKVAPVATGLS